MGRRRAFVRSIKRASRRGVPFTRLCRHGSGARRHLRVGPDTARRIERRQGRRVAARGGRARAAQPVQDRGAEPLQAARSDQGHPAVHHRAARAGPRGARAVHPPRRAPHRAGHQPGRGRGRWSPRGQPHAARLPGRQRHFHRRRARPGPVRSRHLQPRIGRGAQGALRGHVRPGLDRRRDQPGQQVAEAHPLLRSQRYCRQRAPGPRRRGHQSAVRRLGGAAPEPHGLQGRDSGARPGDQRAPGRRAVVRHRPERADPADRQLLLHGRRQPARLWLPLPRGGPGPGRSRELLRSGQAGLRARRRPHRHDPARARLQRERPAPEHAPAGPDSARLPHLGPGHRRHAVAHDTSDVHQRVPHRHRAASGRHERRSTPPT